MLPHRVVHAEDIKRFDVLLDAAGNRYVVEIVEHDSPDEEWPMVSILAGGVRRSYMPEAHLRVLDTGH